MHEKLAGTADWPDFINRDEYTQAEIDALPDQAFADRVNRQFPIHEKAATFLSAVSYYGQCEPDVQLEASLEKAASIHGISENVAKVREILEGWEKSADDGSGEGSMDYALSINYGSDEDPDIQNYLPISTPAEIEDSSMELAKQARANEIPIEVTRIAAQHILKAAAAHGVDPIHLHISCRRIGGELAPNFEKAAALVEYRAHYPGMDEIGMSVYRDLVRAAAADESRLDDFIKLAIETDIAYGVNYDDLHLDPYQIFYSGDAVEDLQKMAKNTVVVDGVMVPRDIFCRIPGAAIEKNFDLSAREKIASAQAKALRDTTEASLDLEGLDSDERRGLLDLALSASV